MPSGCGTVGRPLTALSGVAGCCKSRGGEDFRGWDKTIRSRWSKTCRASRGRRMRPLPSAAINSVKRRPNGPGTSSCQPI